MSVRNYVPGLEPVEAHTSLNRDNGQSVQTLAPQYRQPYQQVAAAPTISPDIPELGKSLADVHTVLVEQPPKQKICGLRRTTFWLSFALVLVVLAASLTGGVAAGIIVKGRNGNGASSSAYVIAASTSAPVQTVTITAGPTSMATISSLLSPTSSSAAASRTGPGGVFIECPSTDNTYYTPPNSKQRFLRQCNTNYGGHDGAIDVATVKVQSMDECIGYCAKYNDDASAAYNCSGVTWVYQGLQGTNVNYCWVKSKLAGKTFFDDMESAILVN